jgi:hypothetical protein
MMDGWTSLHCAALKQVLDLALTTRAQSLLEVIDRQPWLAPAPAPCTLPCLPKAQRAPSSMPSMNRPISQTSHLLGMLFGPETCTKHQAPMSVRSWARSVTSIISETGCIDCGTCVSQEGMVASAERSAPARSHLSEARPDAARCTAVLGRVGTVGCISTWRCSGRMLGSLAILRASDPMPSCRVGKAALLLLTVSSQPPGLPCTRLHALTSTRRLSNAD